MPSFRKALFCLTLVRIVAFSADSSLLILVMPDAKVIAGLQVDQARNSPFGMYVLAHMQLDDPAFLKFMAATGFDPRRDVREVLIASNGLQYDPSHWLVLAKGAFTPARIVSAAQAAGGVATKYRGLEILTSDKQSTRETPMQSLSGAIAFLDASTAVMGDMPGVEAAIDRYETNPGVSTNLAGKVRQISANNDFWFTTLVPLAEFAAAMPDPNLSSAMKGNLLGAVQQASGGLKFGPTVQVYGEAITRSPQDASALVDVVKFIAGLIQTNRQNDKTAAQVSTLLDALRTSAQGNVMTMNLEIPESTLEQMLTTMRPNRTAPGKSPGPKTPAPK